MHFTEDGWLPAYGRVTVIQKPFRPEVLESFPPLTKIRPGRRQAGVMNSEIWLLIASAKPDYCEGSWRKTGGKDAIQFSRCRIVLLGGTKKAEKAVRRACPERLPIRSRRAGGGCSLERTLLRKNSQLTRKTTGNLSALWRRITPNDTAIYHVRRR
jgi:hypothetical protein